MLKYIVPFLVACLYCSACVSDRDNTAESIGLEDWQVERVCRLYMQCEFVDLADEMYDYRYQTDERKQQFVTLMKQHAALRKKKDEYPVQIHYVKSEVYPCDSLADVFVELCYPGGRTETGMFQMIRVNQEWLVR